MSDAALVVEVKNITAGYLPGVNILNGCSLTASKGELIGIIGPNGAGKSTLLKAIFGQVKVREGSILLNGDDITGLAANKLVAKGVGFVPQNNNVFPSLSIEENLQMGLYQKPKMYEERLEFVTSIFAELGKRLKQRAGSLSGGERQMVAMSRALMMDPAVLLLDEPFSAVDHPTRRALHALLAEIRASTPMPILFVSHDVQDAALSADQLCFLSDGKSVESGPTHRLLDDPNSALARWLAR